MYKHFRILTTVFIVSLLSIYGVSAQIKVACVGNSVTYGMTIDNPQENSYPAQLQRLLGEGYNVEKFAKSGVTLLEKGQNPFKNTPYYADACAYGADIVVIHLGLNDTDPRSWPEYKDEFVRDYCALIDSLTHLNPDARVIIARLSPIFDRHPRFESSTRDWYYEVQGLIESIAKHKGAELIDFQSVLNQYPTLMPDALHPNCEGAGLLAKRVYSAITGDFGGLSMSMLYGDNMVLQRGEKVKVSGVANVGDKVMVNLAGKKASAVADESGKWSVELSGVKSGGGYELEISTQNKTLLYKNVMVGEVWLASGQSNMQWKLGDAIGGMEDVKVSKNNNVRLFHMEILYNNANKWDSTVLQEMNNLKPYGVEGWKVSSPNSSINFSAIAYHYATMLSDSLGVPVGVICNAVGGTTTEAFIDRKTIEHTVPALMRNWPNNDFIMPWVRERANLNRTHATSPQQRHNYEPAFLFESGIMPLDRFPLRGVIWYQGESNAHNITLHEMLFSALVESWRANWDMPDMPFYFVQLSSIATRGSWPEFRDSQRRLAEQIEGVKMVVSSDVGDSTDVHPREKKEVARRLVNLSLNDTYNKKHIVPSGPQITSIQVIGKKTELSFDYADGLITQDDKAPRSFEVAELPGVFVPATAKIKGTKIILSNYGNLTPRYVRYGWQPFSSGNVENAQKMPLSTFMIEATSLLKK